MATAVGGSTITQQLVRAVLLPQDVIDNDDTKEGLYLRKAKEILQAYKLTEYLTQEFGDEGGKQEVITAYLNQINYGGVYGVAAAAEVYFGKKLKDVSPSARPRCWRPSHRSPPTSYPYAVNKKGKYANVVKEKYGKKVKRTGKQRTRLVLKDCGPGCADNTEVVNWRNFILKRLREGKGHSTWLSDDQYQEALARRSSSGSSRR